MSPKYVEVTVNLVSGELNIIEVDTYPPYTKEILGPKITGHQPCEILGEWEDSTGTHSILAPSYKDGIKASTFLSVICLRKNVVREAEKLLALRGWLDNSGQIDNFVSDVVRDYETSEDKVHYSSSRLWGKINKNGNIEMFRGTL